MYEYSSNSEGILLYNPYYTKAALEAAWPGSRRAICLYPSSPCYTMTLILSYTIHETRMSNPSRRLSAANERHPCGPVRGTPV